MKNAGRRHRAATGFAAAAVIVVVAAVGVAAAVGGSSSARGGGNARPSSVAAAVGPTAAEEATLAVTQAFEQWLDGSNPEASLAVIEDAAELQPALAEAVKKIPGVASYRGRVSSVHFTSPTSAEVVYSLLANGVLIRVDLTGIAVLVDGRWLVSRETVCNLLALNGIACPQDPYVPTA
jgi:hypothetical protein